MIRYMLLAFWINIFVDLGNSVCDNTDWQQALSRPGWASCSKSYINGLYRDIPVPHDGIDRITAARCCNPPLEYVGKTPVCQIVDWSTLLTKINTWATCPAGFFLNGIYRSNDTWLHNIEQAKCCRPPEYNDTKNRCYDQDVVLSLDKAGLSKCIDGFYLAGVYRGGCNFLHCIEAFKCCKIPKGSKVLGHWLLNGEEQDISYNDLSTFVEGRCPGSKAVKFDTHYSFALAPIIDFNDRSFAISCWINVDQSRNTVGSIYSDWTNPWQFALGVRNQNVIFSRHSKGEEKWWSMESTAIPLNTWIHVVVDWQDKQRAARIYVDGQEVAYKVITPKEFYKPTGNAYQIGMDGMYDQFYGSVMELYVFGIPLTEKQLDQLRGFPVITVKAKGNVVDVTWKPPFQGACPVSIYTVYYRDVSSAIEKNRWTAVNVTGSGTSLSFQCSKEYEVTVTAWTSSGETPLNHSSPFHVTIGGDPPLPPVIENKEVEISGCDVNLTWSASQESSCPLTMFTIYYHEITLEKRAGHEINVTNVTKTTFLLSLQCDKQYGVEMSAWNDAGQSDKSRLLPITTISDTLSTKKTQFVNFQSPAGSRSLSDRQVAGLISGVSAIAVVSLLVFFYCRRQRKKQAEANARIYRRSKLDIIVLEHQETPPHQVTFMEELGRGAFGVVYKGLLKGSPGVEVFCEARKQPVAFKEDLTVAIKVLAGTASEETKEQFLEEIELMKRVGTHRNVLSMVGFWVKSAPIFLLLEYVPFGDLLQWLQKKRTARSTQKKPQISSDAEQDCKEIIFSDKEDTSVKNLPWTNKSEVDLHIVRGSATLVGSNKRIEESQHLEMAESRERASNIYDKTPATASVIPTKESCKDDVELEEDLSAKDLLCFAWQIARGMSFLSSAGFVHRDLAARNVLLGEDKVIKISDFGLMRHLYGDIYEMKRRKRLPIKWTAPEALYTSLYTTKSDVWSYGVLLWELSTMGGTPYPGIDNKELYKLLKTGFRLDKPDTCSDELYKLMSDCWHEEPNERPTFEQLTQTLEQMMTQGTPYLDLESLDESKACYAEKLSDSEDTEKRSSECA